MNTQFNSNVIWLQLEYKISTLVDTAMDKKSHIECSLLISLAVLNTEKKKILWMIPIR